jgi:hypothetical protein
VCWGGSRSCTGLITGLGSSSTHPDFDRTSNPSARRSSASVMENMGGYSPVYVPAAAMQWGRRPQTQPLPHLRLKIIWGKCSQQQQQQQQESLCGTVPATAHAHSNLPPYSVGILFGLYGEGKRQAPHTSTRHVNNMMVTPLAATSKLWMHMEQ